MSCCEIVDVAGAIAPGWVNAHSHLEFSDLESPLGHPSIRFTDWIRLIVSHRNQSNEHRSKSKSIEKGLSESFHSGVRLIGEIATSPFDQRDYASLGESSVIAFFFEQLGRNESAFAGQDQELQQFLDQQISIAQKSEETCSNTFGVSPHAPYSVHPELLKQMCVRAASANRTVAMHVAETTEEIELIENQTGDFVDLLKDFGVWNPESFEIGYSIQQVLKTLSTVPRSLVVHGNYLTDSELDFIATQSGRMSIVYCPRTHAYFGHSRYPIHKMIERGIQVCVGTDSRASNPDVDLFQELKHIVETFPELDPGQVLAMGTIHGARALGFNDHFGSIEPGKIAALNNVTHPDSAAKGSPLEWMFTAESGCCPLGPTAPNSK